MSTIRLTRVEGRGYTHTGRAAQYAAWKEYMQWGTEWTLRVEYITGRVEYRYSYTLSGVREMIAETEGRA